MKKYDFYETFNYLYGLTTEGYFLLDEITLTHQHVISTILLKESEKNNIDIKPPMPSDFFNYMSPNDFLSIIFSHNQSRISYLFSEAKLKTLSDSISFLLDRSNYE